jgi:ADP-ribose pyrophosphatase
MSRPQTDLLGAGDHLRLLRRGGWEYVEHIGGSDSVAVLATTPANEVVLIEQRRPPVDAVVLELPAGIVEPGEPPEQAVVRELMEETGFAGGPPELLLGSPLSAGITSSILYLYRVHAAERRGPGGGIGDELIRVRLVPLPELLRSPLGRGGAVDWHIPAALHLARVRGLA